MNRKRSYNAAKIELFPPETFRMDGFPLFFRPLLKQTIWGGRALGETLGKPIGPETDYAESWEIVDHGDDQSRLDTAPSMLSRETRSRLDGKTLAQLIAENPRWLMGNSWADQHCGESSQSAPPVFPLLLKYLDCNRVLSVQVHPDDTYAQAMPTPDLGKTEAWYIVDATPDALVYAGLKQGVGADDLAAAVTAGQTDQVLHSFHPQPGDCVFIPAGTVHALGAGLLVAEIQQSSNTTFRLFDWNRVGADGRPRDLHVQQSIEVTDFDRGPVDPIASKEIASGDSIVRCDKFDLKVIRGDGGQVSTTEADTFQMMTVPHGSATLRWNDQQRVLQRGQSVLIPAAMRPAAIVPEADATVLLMSLPD